MEGRHKSISYYFTQLNKNEGPCKLDFLKINDNNQSFMKIKNKKNSLSKSEQRPKPEVKRSVSNSHFRVASKARICEKMKENSFNAYMNNSRNIKIKRKDFNTNSSVNISFTRAINTTNEEVSHRALEKIEVRFI